MIRSTLAASLGAATGAIIIAPVHERCLDALLPYPELSAVAMVAGVVGTVWLAIMTCRTPSIVQITAPRDRRGRFKAQA